MYNLTKKRSFNYLELVIYKNNIRNKDLYNKNSKLVSSFFLTVNKR